MAFYEDNPFLYLLYDLIYYNRNLIFIEDYLV